jgi:hypothetical protein
MERTADPGAVVGTEGTEALDDGVNVATGDLPLGYLAIAGGKPGDRRPSDVHDHLDHTATFAVEQVDRTGYIRRQ